MNLQDICREVNIEYTDLVRKYTKTKGNYITWILKELMLHCYISLPRNYQLEIKNLLKSMVSCTEKTGKEISGMYIRGDIQLFKSEHLEGLARVYSRGNPFGIRI